MSLSLHDLNLIFIVGYHDCAGNPVDEATHKKQIHESVARLKNMDFKKRFLLLACGLIQIGLCIRNVTDFC